MNTPARVVTLLAALFPLATSIHAEDGPTIVPANWEKTVVQEGFGTNTAVADDFTGDGQADIIVSNGGKIRLFIGPDWTEHVLHETSFEKRRDCIHSECFDVDGDGDIDYLGSHAFDGVFWLENPGAETAITARWTSRTVTTDLNGTHCLLRADVNKDGKLDVIANHFSPEGKYPDTSLWFEVPDDPTADDAQPWVGHAFAEGDARGGSHYFGFGDVTGDGWGDIAMGAKGEPFEDGNWFAFWTHPGSAEAAEQPWEKTVLQTDQAGATNILPADLNGDGVVDYFASRGHGKGVLWYEAPDWTPHQIHEAIDGPHCLAIADLDEDGDIDAATCGKESRWVEWYENDGKGNFTIHRVGEDQASYDIRLVDLDGDTDLDILIAGQRSKNVVWYANPLR